MTDPDRAGAPPPAFWKLPADADFAFFHGGISETTELLHQKLIGQPVKAVTANARGVETAREREKAREAAGWE